jgi:hypothetical protein
MKRWKVWASITAAVLILAAAVGYWVHTTQRARTRPVATYYVDSTVPGPGTGTIGDPWDDINSNVGTLLAGDVMYLRGGATAALRQNYTEHVDITAANGCVSGTSANPITIANYPGEFVRLMPGAGVGAILDINLDYWVISGTDSDYHIEIDKNGAGSFGFDIDGDHNTVEYLEMHNGQYFMVDINGDDNTMDHCKIYDMDSGTPGTDAHGVFIRGSTSSDNVISNCEIYDCLGDCVQIYRDVDNGYDNVICNNEMYVTAPNLLLAENAIDSKSGNRTLIYGNTMHGFRRPTAGSSDGQPIVLQEDTRDTQIYENVFYNFSGAAVRFDVPTVIFRNNVIYDLVDQATVSNQNVLFLALAAADVQAYNNTIVGRYTTGTNLIRIVSGAELGLHNNVFEDTGEIQNDGGTLTCDYNGWFNPEEVCSGAHDVTGTTAGFVDKAGNDYHLDDLSPCIDVGLDVGLSKNGTARDLGAYEWEAEPAEERLIPPSPAPPAAVAGADIGGSAAECILPTRVGVNRIIPRRQVVIAHFPHTRGGEPRMIADSSSSWFPVPVAKVGSIRCLHKTPTRVY